MSKVYLVINYTPEGDNLYGIYTDEEQAAHIAATINNRIIEEGKEMWNEERIWLTEDKVRNSQEFYFNWNKVIVTPVELNKLLRGNMDNNDEYLKLDWSEHD